MGQKTEYQASELIILSAVSLQVINAVCLVMFKSLPPIPVLLFVIVSMLIPAIADAQNGTLVVTIKNISPSEGNLVVGIFDKKENFPIDGRQLRKTTLKVSATEMTYTVELPSQKDYALAIFHDRNADGIIGRNWLGVPTEHYGFSNNIRPTLSAPEFEQVKFRLEQSTSLEINLK